MSLDVDPSGVEAPQEPVSLPDSPSNLSIEDVLRLAAEAEQPVAAVPEVPAEPAPVVETPPVPVPVVEPPKPQADPEVLRILSSLEDKERRYEEAIRQAEEARKRYEPLAKYAEVERALQERDAAGALQAMGVDVKEFVKAVAEGRGVSPGRALHQQVKQEMEALTSPLKQELQALREYQQQQLQKEAMVEIGREISTRSPILSALGSKANDLVMQAMRGHYERTGQVLQYEQVIPQIETQYRKFLESALSNETVRKELKVVQGDTQAVVKQGAEAPKTLTNKVAAQVTQRTVTPDLPEDREERIKAILALHG